MSVPTHPCGSSCNERLHHWRPDAHRQLPMVLVANRGALVLRCTVTPVSALGLHAVNVDSMLQFLHTHVSKRSYARQASGARLGP